MASGLWGSDAQHFRTSSHTSGRIHPLSLSFSVITVRVNTEEPVSKSLLRGDVSRRTTCPETSTLNYELEQMNLCRVKKLRFCGSMFLCYPILTNITLLAGLVNGAHLLE